MDGSLREWNKITDGENHLQGSVEVRTLLTDFVIGQAACTPYLEFSYLCRM
jgi:hypothetical protein